MNCPRCGENNPDNYKFCGMCGNNLLSTSKPVEKPAAKAPAEQSQASPHRAENMAFSRMEPRGGTGPSTIALEEPRPARRAEVHRTDEPVEPIAGPSLLGLNQPTPDSIRETSFRGMTTYYPEQRHPAWGRILLTLIFIVGLVAVGWWRYKNYGVPGHGMPAWLSAMNKTSPPSDNQSPQFGAKSADRSANQNADQNKNSDQNKAAASTETPAPASQTGDSPTPSDQPNTASDKTSENKPAESKSTDSASAKPAAKDDHSDEPASAPEKPAKTAKATPASATDDSAPATKLKPAAASAEGDGLFRKGESYLYGRGVAESCSQAIRYLKSASDKSNARARSTFGTMYATGHCVPRDLPTSYRWFAMALQADPNNSILEKDLSAIWNQMTPPERQLATKLKPNGE